MSCTFRRMLVMLLLASVMNSTSNASSLGKIDLQMACERLVAYYPIPRDNFDGPAYGNMFTADGEFILRGVATKGRENIVDGFLARALSLIHI